MISIVQLEVHLRFFLTNAGVQPGENPHSSENTKKRSKDGKWLPEASREWIVVGDLDKH